MTHPKIRRAGESATILKLADRIANVEHGGGSVEMYRTEYPDFRYGLYNREHGKAATMWAVLDTHLGWKPMAISEDGDLKL